MLHVGGQYLIRKIFQEALNTRLVRTSMLRISQKHYNNPYSKLHEIVEAFFERASEVHQGEYLQIKMTI